MTQLHIRLAFLQGSPRSNKSSASSANNPKARTMPIIMLLVIIIGLGEAVCVFVTFTCGLSKYTPESDEMFDV